MKATLILAVLGSTALLLTACESRKAPSQSTTTVTAASVELGPEPDYPLTRRVEAAIASNPELTVAARNVGVEVIDGVASLEGSVDDAATKTALDREVRAVPGITDTLDKIAVATDANENDEASDDTIAGSLQRTLSYDPSMRNDRDKVTIDVQHGIVTLRGVVSTPELRERIERMVEATPGVVVVRNRLETPGAV